MFPARLNGPFREGLVTRRFLLLSAGVLVVAGLWSAGYLSRAWVWLHGRQALVAVEFHPPLRPEEVVSLHYMASNGGPTNLEVWEGTIEPQFSEISTRNEVRQGPLTGASVLISHTLLPGGSQNVTHSRRTTIPVAELATMVELLNGAEIWRLPTKLEVLAADLGSEKIEVTVRRRVILRTGVGSEGTATWTFGSQTPRLVAAGLYPPAFLQLANRLQSLCATSPAS